MLGYKETLRSLALDDGCFMEAALGMGHDTVEASRLDTKTHALVRLAAALAVGAAPSSYHAAIELAFAPGASARIRRERRVGDTGRRAPSGGHFIPIERCTVGSAGRGYGHRGRPASALSRRCDRRILGTRGE
jgi:hypothetical protein